MALVVQKFGGTSVGTIERIRAVACRVLDSAAKGDRIVVVVSAMAGETNRLVQLAHQIHPMPYSREYDLLIASGEQVAVGLLSLAINTEAERRGFRPDRPPQARPLLGYQIGILTDSVFSKARIRAIDSAVLHRELDCGMIPVIAGFQGVDPENNITTLGRGGSDTSAVAIAAALKADDCEIYTDVNGIYTADPRFCPQARKLIRISYEEMMELASLGAKVLQIRSVELAAKHRVILHVRSSFNLSEGTRVVSKNDLGPELEQVVVSGVATDSAQVKWTLQNIADRPGVAARIFGALSEASVVVDVIVQDIPAPGLLTVSFTVGASDRHKTYDTLESLRAEHFTSMRILAEDGLAKVSIVGAGMQHHPGVAARMFKILAQHDIDIKLITTSEIKISCLIEASRAPEAVKALHEGFELEKLL